MTRVVISNITNHLGQVSITSITICTALKTLWRIHLIKPSGVGVRLKVGINIQKSEGVGPGEGLCPPQLRVWGLPPEKNQFCAKNYAILSKFWYFFPILQHKFGGIIPSPKSGDLSPCPPPCSHAYDKITQLHHRKL